MRNSTTKKSFVRTGSKIAISISAIAFLAIIWVIISAIQKNPTFFPSFKDIFIAMGKMVTTKSTLLYFSYSFLRTILVVIISLLASILICLIYVFTKKSIYFIKPIMIIMKATPLAIISLYLWMSVGGRIAPYIITGLVILPVTVEGLIAAIDNIDADVLDAVRLEPINVFQKYTSIYIPMVLPFISMTLLQTFGLGIKVMIMAEYICQTPKSIGYYISLQKINFAYDSLFASLIIIVAIVALIEWAIKSIANKIEAK